ncbi:FecR family protein [Pseudorhodoferax sp.]|uniref:FecR family protein n=1 Tax=Pseudorhodoferax sp. TaxID=1993553 RepID=UPI002DD67E5E|nr:FecR domain-containing protein [Pseudorhodoferax sp.]
MSLPSPATLDDAALRQAARDWFVRRQRGQWARGEQQQFAAWLAADPRHADALARCEAHWDRFEGMPADLLQRMRRQLRQDQAKAIAPRRGFLRPAFALAGVAAVTGGAGFLAWQQWQAQVQWSQAFRTARGQQQELTLPDGSRLRVDTATRLQAAFTRGRRDVRLQEGEAFFDVQSDPARPFFVQAGPLQVRVVGTRFSVRHTPGLAGNDGVQVAVEHGRVRVTGRDDASVLLGAGEAVAGDSTGALAPVAAAGPVAPWREHRLSFLDRPLGQALAELERYGDTGLVVRDPAVAALRLTATVDPLQPAALHRALPRVLPVRLQEEGARAEVLLR